MAYVEVPGAIGRHKACRAQAIGPLPWGSLPELRSREFREKILLGPRELSIFHEDGSDLIPAGSAVDFGESQSFEAGYD